MAATTEHRSLRPPAQVEDHLCPLECRDTGAGLQLACLLPLTSQVRALGCSGGSPVGPRVSQINVKGMAPRET